MVRHRRLQRVHALFVPAEQCAQVRRVRESPLQGLVRARFRPRLQSGRGRVGKRAQQASVGIAQHDAQTLGRFPQRQQIEGGLQAIEFGHGERRIAEISPQGGEPLLRRNFERGFQRRDEALPAAQR
jgi:hypothetical protein